jgi:hypothetical protein
MILINKIDNGTFPAQDASLPVWTGPNSTVIWIHTFAYTGLSAGLLAAFGAVLCKQWLGYFKTSRFGWGSIDERCKQRQRKHDGLETWHFNTIIAFLPTLLQLSFLFFGIALAAHTWTQQHTVASIIIGSTTLGVLFYTFTVIASLISPNCPFQTPVSTALKHVFQSVAPLTRRKFWAGFLGGLQSFLRGALQAGKQLIYKSISCFAAHFSRIGRMARHPPVDEEVGESDDSEPSGALDLKSLDSIAESIEGRSVQWVLETSTDFDMVTAAVSFIPEVELPNDVHVIDKWLDLANRHFHQCFESQLPLAKGTALACLKAVLHLDFGELKRDFTIDDSGTCVWSNGRQYQMQRDRDFSIISCSQGKSSEVEIKTLSLSDRMWLAHMFVIGLHNNHRSSIWGSEFKARMIFHLVDVSLRDPTSPPRLVADCLLLAGQLMGLKIDRQHLARLDKRYDSLFNAVRIRLHNSAVRPSET